MKIKDELKLAYGIGIFLLLVGVICYAAAPQSQPEEPMRMMFDSAAGKILFDHKIHTSDTGYGISCLDCHHHPAESDLDTQSCTNCHPPEEVEKPPQACNDCHEADEIEDAEVIRKVDAFHKNCVECHKDYEAGPVECASCHVM